MAKTIKIKTIKGAFGVIIICLAIFAVMLFGFAVYQMTINGDPDPFKHSLKGMYHVYMWVIILVMISILGGLMYVLISKAKPE